MIVHERLRHVAPDLTEERIVFARMMLNGLVTPPVLLFLTSGITTFSPDLSACLAVRVADALTDDHPVCEECLNTGKVAHVQGGLGL